jgi:beta-galactosidase
MARTIIPLNRDWTYVPSWKPEWASSPVPSGKDGEAVVDLPHTNRMLPFNNFDENSYQFVSCYQKRIAIPFGEKVYLDFEGIASCSEVYVEGEKVISHECGYTPFAVDLSRWAGREVLVSVKVDSTERPDVPPFGNVIDYLTYGGIYREASLRVLPASYIANVYPRPRWDSVAARAGLAATVYVAAAPGASFSGIVRLTLSKDGREIGRAESRAAVSGTADVGESRSAAGEEASIGFVLDFGELDDIKPWALDDPELYELTADLIPAGKGRSDDSATSDSLLCKIGFREARIEPDGFYLNGKRIVIRGLDRHQSYPYAGYAMPERIQKRDAEILKRELSVNCVRTSHYPQSRHFLDACDELGLLVLEEIPGWQHIGGPEWKERAVENVRAMIVRDWAHPSIFLWGVRINESRDDHDFYARTNSLARSLDSTRQTCGVRCFEGSELLEDVYTMNDFVMGSGQTALRFQRQITGKSYNVPYLVTENCGHMYPARRFDNEERLVEHALRHARIHDAAALNGDTAGALSWVFADYNTHCQFGSGDRICYHGVLDMFRIPKFAAYGYSAQREVSEGPLLEPLTVWARGERSECSIMPLVVMTNCDEVGLAMGSVDKGRFKPDFLKWAGLMHPPVVIKADEGVWGMAWQDVVFTGYVGGKAVIEKRFAADPVPVALKLEPDSRKLRAQGPGEAWDVTRVVVRLVDRYGNHLPFAFDPVKVTIEGPGVLVGPAEFSLMGGVSAMWVRATGEGSIRIKAHVPGLEASPLEIAVRRS